MSNQTTYNEALGKALDQAARLQGDVDRLRKNGDGFTNWNAQHLTTRVHAVSQLAKACAEAEETLKLVNLTRGQLQTLLDDFSTLRDRLLTVQATAKGTINEALPGK